MPAPATSIKPANIVRQSYKQWLKGTITAFQDGRTPADGLVASGNVVLDQDGTIRPRPSMVKYGTTLPGTALGEVFEFIQTTTTTTIRWMMVMCNVAGTARPYVSKDGGAWQASAGNTYTNTAAAHYVQIDDKIVIMNGQDALSYFDVTTVGAANTIVTFTSLGPPTGVGAVKTGLGGTTLTYYYKVSYNSTFGQTASSADATIQVDRARGQWDATTNFVTISWTPPAGAPANATANVYVGTAAGQEFLIAAGLNGTSFKDTGTLIADVTKLAPTFDNTTGPPVTRGWVINGQLFLTGDKNHPRYIWYGGTGQAVLDFSALNGGGWVEIARGSKQFPVRVVPFRDHAGNPIPVALCQGTNGQGKRYTMTPTSVTYGSQVINYFNIQEDNGQAGTDSPDGVVVYNDNIWYPSKDGFKTTGTKPQLQNVLSTDTISETILNDVLNLNTAYMASCVGLGWQNKLYWALANGSSVNNEIWVLDLQRGGAWMKPWSISAQWMALYNANTPANGGDGLTHFLVLAADNTIYELSYASATADNGVAFNTNITSGLIKFSEDGMDWARLIDVTFIFLRPQGQINCLVTGRTEDAEVAPLGNTNVTPTATVAGWGEAGWGGSPDAIAPLLPEIFGWSDFSVVPTIIGTSRYPITIDVDEDVNYFSWEIDTNTSGVDYQLSDIVARFVLIGVKDLS